MRRVVDDAYKAVLALLSENRARLDALAAALLERETLDEDAAYAAASVEHPVSEVSARSLPVTAQAAQQRMGNDGNGGSRHRLSLPGPLAHRPLVSVALAVSLWRREPARLSGASDPTSACWT